MAKVCYCGRQLEMFLLLILLLGHGYAFMFLLMLMTALLLVPMSELLTMIARPQWLRRPRFYFSFRECKAAGVAVGNPLTPTLTPTLTLTPI